MLFKKANSEVILISSNQIAPEKALGSTEITERFRKFAQEIKEERKKVATRSDEFLYFIARGIHAMEHAAIDPVSRQYNSKLGHIALDNGHGQCKTCSTVLSKCAKRQPISGLWCTASEIEPWINQNGDAFPESELLADIIDPKDSTKTIKAYQTFIGKGLFTDHKSGEVENIRGIILDAAYDATSKGVDLLIALDRINYPELARQVSAGYSAQVSMGTQVSFSLCSICGNKAVTEHDYCNHVASGKGLARAGQARCYEVNSGLNFIELSMVGNGADPRARVRTIVAQLNEIRKQSSENIKPNAVEPENRLILESINRLETQVKELQASVDISTTEPLIQEQEFTSEIQSKIASLESQIKEIGGRFMSQKTQEKKAYMQGTVEPDLKNSFEMADKSYHQYWEADVKQSGPDQTNGSEGTHQGYGQGSDEEVKKMYYRANAEQRKKIRQDLLKKVSYMQGTVEPDLKNTFDMADKDYHKSWEEDKHMMGEGMESGSDGLHPGYGRGSDEQVKKELLRAKLRAKLEKSANPSKNKWTVFAGEQPVLSVTADEAYGSELSLTEEDQTNQEWFDSRNYGINLIQAIKSLGLEKVASKIAQAKTSRKVKVAQAAPEAAPAAPEAAPAAPEAAQAAPAMVDSPEGPETEAAEMDAAEGIRAAAERVESAKDEILSLVENLEGMHKEEGQELASEMGAASEGLTDLGTEMEATASVSPRLVRYALNHADTVLAEAEAFVAKVTETTEKTAKKKLPEALRKMMEAKKEKAKAKKKKEKEAFTNDELQTRKDARRAFAQQLYNLTEGDMIAEAHPDGGNTTTFPNQAEGKIETQTEAQEKDTEVANSTPRGELVARRNSRERLVMAAERFVKADATSEAAATKAKADQATKDAAAAAAKAAEEAKAKTTTTQSVNYRKTAEVDKETKQYYKEESSQSATGQKPDKEVSAFYNDLVSDFSKKKSTAATHDFGLKMKRAFSVALKRASLGQIESNQEAIDVDVDRLMNLDDESFTAFAEVVENTKRVKTTMAAPAQKQVRTAGALTVGINEQTETFSDQLVKLPWK